MKLLVGLALGALIGIGCRLFALPVPGPNAILGALLGIAMAAGYEVTDRVLSRRADTTARGSSTLSVSPERRPDSTAETPPP
jgi:XapX domain-containing protein